MKSEKTQKSRKHYKELLLALGATINGIGTSILIIVLAVPTFYLIYIITENVKYASYIDTFYYPMEMYKAKIAISSILLLFGSLISYASYKIKSETSFLKRKYHYFIATLISTLFFQIIINNGRV